MGMFVSTMPLTVSLEKGMTANDLIERVRYGHMELFRHQKYPLSEILRYLREKKDFQGKLYDVMVSYQNAATGIEAETKWYSNGYSEVPFTIHIDNRDGKESHTITVDYQTAVFSQEEEVVLIIERLWHILSQIIESSGITIDEISILPGQERGRVIEGFNNTYVEYSREKCVHELFTEQAWKTPDKIALVFENREFTY